MWYIHTMNSVLNKDVSSDIFFSIDELWRHYAEWNKSVIKKTNTIWFIYMKCLEQSNSKRQKVESWLQGTGGGRNGEFTIQWVWNFSFARWKISEYGWWLQQYECTWTVYLKMITRVNFMLCIFATVKKFLKEEKYFFHV